MNDTPDQKSITTGMTTIGGQIVLSERLVQFRRLYRWFNLTVVHQGIWPLLLLTTSAPPGKPGALPFDWYLARLAGPVMAVLAALLYLRHQPNPEGGAIADAGAGRPGIAAQVRAGLVMLAGLLIAARLIAGPIDPALQIVVFGIADVAAFHLIHFGVVRRTYPEANRGAAMAVTLFGLSWGLRDLMLTALGPDEASPVFALLTGFVLGSIVASGSRWLSARLGAFWPAATLHFILVYLIIGFAD